MDSDISYELTQKKINKRKIFYLSGYDPRGVRFYYNNLKFAVEKFCTRDSIIIEISEKQKISSLETYCSIYNKNDDVITEYSFLHWDDIIKKSWIKSIYELFFVGLKIYADIFLNLSWKKTLQLSYYPVITLFYPFLTLITAPLLITILASFIYCDYGISILYFILSCYCWVKFLPKLNSLWLLRFFIFNHQFFINYSKIYDNRAKKFSDIIRQSFDESYDEIILIAHSNGSIATIPILKYLNNVPNHFKILSFGHCIPLITMNKKSCDYLAIIHEVREKNLKWFDIGFPPDGACYAKTNPFHSYDYINQSIKVKFKSISPQFFKYYSKNYYHQLKRDKFNLHFSYLVTHDMKSNTEFIDILTSKQPLEIRFN